jgi:monofunctional biosynthetic peptidoglycan transglycosylase
MPRRRKKAPFWKRSLRRLALLFVLLLLLGWLPVLLLRWINPPVTAFMLQQHPDGLEKARYYTWMDWHELGSAAALATMAAEDQKFPDHRGFDVSAIHTAIMRRLDGEPLRGASTITQQVAKNLFLWPGRSFLRKAIEAYFTVIIEFSWPKQRILEIYLNIAEFGPGIYGVPAASQRYFAKAPRQLNAAEAALLAAVLPNPSRLRVDQPSPHVRERQRWIMRHAEQLEQRRWLARIEQH